MSPAGKAGVLTRLHYRGPSEGRFVNLPKPLIGEPFPDGGRIKHIFVIDVKKRYYIFVMTWSSFDATILQPMGPAASIVGITRKSLLRFVRRSIARLS